MTKIDKSSRVQAAQLAVGDDPSYEFETVDGRQVLRRAASGKGNTLDWKLIHKPGDPTVLEFEKKTDTTNITVTVIPTSMRPAASSIKVTSPDGGPLDPRVFAALRLRELLTEITEQMASPFLRYLVQRTGESDWIDPFLDVPTPGRKGRPHIEYAVWADKYVLAVRKTGGRPMALLEAENSGFKVAAIRSILHKARTRGLLGEARAGRAGGELTQTAIDLLIEDGHPITSGEN